MGQWEAINLPESGSPGFPGESKILITEDKITFLNGGGSFSNGHYDTYEDKCGYTAFEGDQFIDFYREGDNLYVYFAGGDYADSSSKSDGFGTEVTYKRCVDCEDWEPV